MTLLELPLLNKNEGQVITVKKTEKLKMQRKEQCGEITS